MIRLGFNRPVEALSQSPGTNERTLYWRDRNVEERMSVSPRRLRLTSFICVAICNTIRCDRKQQFQKGLQAMMVLLQRDMNQAQLSLLDGSTRISGLWCLLDSQI